MSSLQFVLLNDVVSVSAQTHAPSDDWIVTEFDCHRKQGTDRVSLSMFLVPRERGNEKYYNLGIPRFQLARPLSFGGEPNEEGNQ